MEETRAGEDGEQEAADESLANAVDLPEVPPPIVPTAEELKREFPDAPKAPWSLTVDAKDFKPEDLIAGQMEVSYGGQVRETPACRG